MGVKGYPNQAAYAASKHGIMGFTKSLAVEVQEHNIRVSAILPGGVDTELFREARDDVENSAMMHPADIAHAVTFFYHYRNVPPSIKYTSGGSAAVLFKIYLI